MTEARPAEHWRSKAEETRRIADARRGDSKEAMLDVAQAYDKLAEITEKSSERTHLARYVDEALRSRWN